MNRNEVEKAVRKAARQYVRGADYWQTLRVWCDNVGDIEGVNYDHDVTPNTSMNGDKEATNIRLDPWDIAGTVDRVMEVSQDAKTMIDYLNAEVARQKAENAHYQEAYEELLEETAMQLEGNSR